MKYICNKCRRETKLIRTNDEKTAWICDKCFFSKSVLEYKNVKKANKEAKHIYK